jgi:hypothetical protein
MWSFGNVHFMKVSTVTNFCFLLHACSVIFFVYLSHTTALNNVARCHEPSLFTY